MTLSIFSDEAFMREAIKEAKIALGKNEVPIGAVIVCQNKVIARAHNLTETLMDATAHAELQAFTSASNYMGSKYLTDCILYVTIEPCVMCAGAAFWTQIPFIVYGADDPKRGFSLTNSSLLHPKTTLRKGILEKECADLIKEFFKLKR